MTRREKFDHVIKQAMACWYWRSFGHFAISCRRTVLIVGGITGSQNYYNNSTNISRVTNVGRHRWPWRSAYARSLFMYRNFHFHNVFI